MLFKIQWNGIKPVYLWSTRGDKYVMETFQEIRPRLTGWRWLIQYLLRGKPKISELFRPHFRMARSRPCATRTLHCSCIFPCRFYSFMENRALKKRKNIKKGKNSSKKSRNQVSLLWEWRWLDRICCLLYNFVKPSALHVLQICQRWRTGVLKMLRHFFLLIWVCSDWSSKSLGSIKTYLSWVELQF